MTLTLELSPAEEARLAAAASQNGLEPAALAKQLVTEHLPALQNGALAAMQEQERIARIRAATGSIADDSWDSVAELHRNCQADKAKEEAATQALLKNGIIPQEDLDTSFWKEAATLKGNHALALPDAFCLALARRDCRDDRPCGV